MSFKTLQQEFRQRVRGECAFDDETRDRFATAACWYRIKPFGVVAPLDAADVVNVVTICRDAGIPITARGGGTGLAGQAVGSGMIVDFTRHMNRIVSMGDSSATVHPGVILNDLNTALATSGKWFPVDPTSMSLCTIGGMIGTNASGWHGLKYGSTKHHTRSLTTVLADGTVSAFGPSPPAAHTDSRIHQSAEAYLRPHESALRKSFPDVRKNSAGYNLIDAVGAHPVDCRKLVIGSEGTLALVVEAELNTRPLPPSAIGILLYLPDYASTVAATECGLTCGPSAVEILDRSYFGLHDPADASVTGLIVPAAKTMLYFEFELTHPEDGPDVLNQFGTAIAAIPIVESKILETELHRNAFWKLRESVSRKINLEKSFGKSSFIEDVAVPVNRMSIYLTELRKILDAARIEYSLYGHAGVGNIHCGTFVNLQDPAHYRAVDTVAADVFDLVISLGGTISGEHGTGFVRTPFLERMYGAHTYELFRGVKKIFDPEELFNPGKIVGPQNVSILHDIDFARGTLET